MKSVNKPFSKVAYEKYDKPAKKAVIKYLQSLGYTATHKEDFNTDIVVTHKNGTHSYHEAEVKAVWDHHWPEPWKTVHIPYRKVRLLGIKPVGFWVLNRHKTLAWVIDSPMLKKAQTVEVSNSKIQNGELFFDVPVEWCTLVNLDIS